MRAKGSRVFLSISVLCLSTMSTSSAIPVTVRYHNFRTLTCRPLLDNAADCATASLPL